MLVGFACLSTIGWMDSGGVRRTCVAIDSLRPLLVVCKTLIRHGVFWFRIVELCFDRHHGDGCWLPWCAWA